MTNPNLISHQATDDQVESDSDMENEWWSKSLTWPSSASDKTIQTAVQASNLSINFTCTVKVRNILTLILEVAYFFYQCLKLILERLLLNFFKNNSLVDDSKYLMVQYGNFKLCIRCQLWQQIGKGHSIGLPIRLSVVDLGRIIPTIITWLLAGA